MALEHTGLGWLAAVSAPSRSDRDLRIVAAAVLIYLLGLACFYPASTVITDEVGYLEPAYAFSQGSVCLEKISALSGEVYCRPSGGYLPGTSAVMAPFVALFGWRGAYLVPALAVAVATLCTASWLRAAGRSPLFALMVLGYPPLLVLGRTAMSDVPSAALAALGLWLFWTGGADRRGRWLASGFIAGLSLSFRETNVLLFGPFYLGVLIRREKGVGPLVAGGIAGSMVRPLLTAIVFDDPFYVFPTSYTFAWSHVSANLPIYALALLVFVPGGLIAALLYRGERWPEVVATAVIFCGVYLSYGYRGEESGLLKGLILGPRYFAPLTPLLAFAAAETFPRLRAHYRERHGWSGTVQAVERLGPLCLRLWVIGVMVLAFVVHPIFAALSGSAERFREAIYSHSSEGSVVVIDRLSSGKFVNELFGERGQVELRRLTPEILDALLMRHGSVTVALLDRRDSAFWRKRGRENAEMLDRLRSQADFELLFEADGGTLQRLRIWRVRSYRPDDLKRRRAEVVTRG
jgi:4-amino-4-deoxy-L-arabinose transferase-like glycosyltransferase